MGSSGSTGDTPQISGTPEVPRWELHEFELHGPCRVENPFRDATLLGDFTSPSRRTISVAGLHDGGDTWYGLRDDSHTNRYTFTVQDEGAAYQLGALHDFFTALPFWRMQPFDGVTGSAVVDRQRPWVNPTPPRAAEPPA